MVRRKHIRTLVERLLAEHAIRSGPVDVAGLANALGVEVRQTPAEDELSGFLYRDRNRKTAVIGVNADHHPNRRNFTAAHELGHYLLHDFDDVHVDRDFKVWLRSDASSKGTDVEEKEANLFAAELLMPARFLKRDVEKIGTVDVIDADVLQELAGKYGVSTQAMTFRLAYLGYLHQ
ncbi:MAG TPA: ImmA/IrrE family metallo-endopeptidase [Candidatus Saccharimonadales bacterium]|nr:ImmA/IrrE family metallo-endopeptidase [Candidatus Saccharimonadales bacterium]